MSAGLNPGQRRCNSQQLMQSLTPGNKVNKMTTEYSTLWGICIEHHHPNPRLREHLFLEEEGRKNVRAGWGRGL